MFQKGNKCPTKKESHTVSTKVLPLVSQAYFIASCEVVHLVSQHTTAAITFSSKCHLPVPLWAEFCGAVSHLDAPNGCLARRELTAWKSEQEKT